MLSCVMWPEARAGSPSAAAPRGRRLQRRGRRRIMRPRSWPGRVDPDLLGSGRAGVPEATAQQKPEPDAATWTAERNDPGTGHGEVKAQRLRTSGCDARGSREVVRKDSSGFFHYRASKSLAVLREETALSQDC